MREATEKDPPLDFHLTFSENTNGYMEKSFKVRKSIFSQKSPFQTVDIIEALFFGRMLLNDGLVMTSERDEFAYHEMITHVPMFTHPHPEKVLVIGGGDGGTVREVLRHKHVRKCTMVEIDEVVVNACRDHLPQTGHVFQNRDPRFELIIDDGVKYIENTHETFDLILVDSTDPIGPATPLFGETFYSYVREKLNPNGIVVSQGESPWHDVDIQKSLLKILGKAFPICLLYSFNNVTYPDGLWSFTFASLGSHPLKNFQEQRARTSPLSFEYYNEEIHRASFALPNFMKRNYHNLLKGIQV